MVAEGNKLKRRHWGITTLSLFLGMLIFLSGCSSFETNPVFQSLQEGDPYVDLTRENLDILFNEYGTEAEPTTPEVEEANVQERALLDSFVTRVQQAEALEYQRLISYADQQPEPVDDVDNFLLAPLLQITEEKGKAIVTDIEEKRRVFKNESDWYFFQLESFSLEETAAETEASLKEDAEIVKAKILPYPRLTDTLLGELCSNVSVTLLSVETQKVGEASYIAYNVKEDNDLAKWVFNDHGNLFLRIYLDGERPVAVRYDFLNFEPAIQPNFFTLEGAQTLPSVAPIVEEKEEAKEEELKDPEKKVETIVETIKEAPEKTEAIKEEPKLEEKVTSPPKAAASPTPAPASEEKVTTPETPAKKEPVKEVKPQVVPDFSGGKMAEPPKEEPKEEPDLTIKLPDNYPDNFFPLVGGFQLVSASDTVDALQRDIYVMGKVEAGLDGVTNFYERLFSLAYPASEKEMYDEDNNETYVLFTGRKDGWAYTVEVTESHFTGLCTVSIRLRR